MTVWSLAPGCERPVPGFTYEQGAHVSSLSALGQITPDEIAERCYALGARVDRDGNKHKIAIYPPDRTKRPVFISKRFAQDGSDRKNALSNLRLAGLDLAATEEPEMATPADLARTATPIRKPVLTSAVRDEFLEILSELEGRLGAVEATNADLVGRIEELEARPAAGRSPSRAETIREQVMDYMRTIPGIPQTPLTIEAILSERGVLPKGTGKTQVGGACAALAKTGELVAGGATGPFRGMYRLKEAQK